jgi:parvulin-like peptidyl-prolyl isomerase
MFETDNESISDADFQQRYQNMLNSIGVSDSDYRKAVLDGLLNQELLQYYIDQIPESGEQVTVERIIVFNESAANEVTQKWREGETFETLSEQYGNLSDSGWIIKGTMEEEFDNVAFSIDIGNISDPIPSTTGYYIIKVLDRTDGPITEEMRQQTGLADYNKWFSQEYAAKVERNPKLDLTEVYAWAIKQLS